MRGTPPALTNAFLIKPVGANSVRPLPSQTNFCRKHGCTECPPTGLRREPIVCTDFALLIHPENAEGFFSTPSPQGKAWVGAPLHKLVGSRFAFCMAIHTVANYRFCECMSKIVMKDAKILRYARG